MTWEEHLTELQRIHEACEHNQPLLPHSTYRMLMKHLAALEVDRYCKGEDPYRFLWGMSSLYTDFAPNPAECNAEGYPTTLREASKRLRSYEPTRWQVDRLLGYADWIQVHGWQAVDPAVSDELRRSYQNAGIDPQAIDFLWLPREFIEGLLHSGVEGICKYDTSGHGEDREGALGRRQSFTPRRAL